MEQQVFISNSVEETQAAATRFAKRLKAGDVVCLEGDLGAGKTHFVKGVAAFFGVDEHKVSSPTYTLIHEYEGKMPIYHFDCYRLKTPQEAIDIGAEDYFYGDGLCLVEWPQIIQNLLPENTIWIKISHILGSQRKIEIQEQD